MIRSDAELCVDCRDLCGEVVEADGWVTTDGGKGKLIPVCAPHAYDYDYEGDDVKQRRKPYKVDQSRYVVPWPVVS